MNTDTRQQIETALGAFSGSDLRSASIGLLNSLGYQSEKTLNLDNTPDAFLAEFDKRDRQFRKNKALFERWKSVEFLFQITDDEVRNAGAQGRLFDSGYDHGNYQSYLFFALDLKKNHYTRTQLADITREINLLFDMPTMLLIRHNGALTFSIIDRRLHKKDQSRDVLEKVKLIKDIRYEDPHRAHIEILYDLALPALIAKHECRDFKQLHEAWRTTLDTNELNKKFYRELADWYFWAIDHVEFPPDAEKDTATRNSTSVIRLITRLIFVWFLKEKMLVPEILFNKKTLDEYLKYEDINNSTYYKAILQNLFFATLNTKMKKDDKESRKFVNRQYGVQVFYRYERYFKDKKRALKLFEAIPFLNGGLFENLDKNIGKGDEIRIDCFTNSPKKSEGLKVPDALFFGDKIQIDLSKEFGNKKRKKETVRGIIHILNSYKFTITENTPIEEEIALDPELLGKVFENLLASYNPETQTTARKQTGSFYTPREIVDYMVDESLKASLSNLVSKKIDNATEDDIKTGLDILFEYTEKEHAFTDNEVFKIVEAISELKILDPACGSGAFPMGILHKLVFILNKIDRDNKKWRELQKQRAVKETEKAYSVGDKEERHQRLKEIEKAFDFNTSDYGRKLFLIENSIYGVDIQPIAVQIAKLRFFISLIVDQNTDEDKENLGILPLPNLETKFVAANTLIGFEKGGGRRLIGFDDPKIKGLQNELAKIRHEHFNSRTPQTKRKWRENDKKVREQVKNRLIILYKKDLERRIKNSSEQKELEYYQTMIYKFKNDKNKRTEYEQEQQNVLEKIEKIKSEFRTGTNKVAQHLASWNPYDQNAAADFFDSEWMFNISGGFDVVIGNPPYVRQEKIKEMKPILKGQYDCYTSMADLYVYFYERGFQVLKTGGILTYISSNKYFRAGYGKKLRKFLNNKAGLHQLINFGDAPVFTSIAYPSIIILCKENEADKTSGLSSKKVSALNWKPGPAIEDFPAIFKANSFCITQKDLSEKGWQLEPPEVLRLLDKLRKAGIPLGKFVKGRLYYGIKTGLNEAFVVDRDMRDRLIAEDPASAEVLKPYLRGQDIKRWRVNFADRYLIKIESSKNKQHPWSGKSVKEAEKIFAKTYPAIYSRFEGFRPKLVKRDDQGKYFWELRSCAYWKDFEKLK